MDSLLEQLAAQRDSAQSELAETRVALLELQAKAASAEEALVRLKGAIAALNGESAAAPPPKQKVAAGGGDSDSKPDDVGSTPTRPASQPDNPLANLKCKGCGTVGSLQQTYIQASSGAPVGMLVCGSCKNQVPMGF